MTSKQSHEERLLEAALSLETASERQAFLASIGDSTLRRRLEALVASSAEADSFFRESPVQNAGGADPGVARTVRVTVPLMDPPAQMIGRYKLLEKIGEGGFGEVWMAEQREPIKRRVALKIIRLGMDSRQIVARFEAERQALAMMDYPNIAKIFDADVTETGRPYFVMELVRGVKITEYCDVNQVPTLDRLKLFIQVCQAVQHAHQKGIIHRDIKPSNILVTLHDGVPVPKVIDFGIAKATQQELTDKTVFTQFQQFIGTPAYISPEQAEMSGLDIDTRADIYSLGVLWYELLVGSTPFDAKELLASGIDAMRKTIREKEPVRPSTKLEALQGEELTSMAKRRSADTSKLANLLRGDLDWIVMKCLEKDRTRRYETANGLAFDLKRHLNNEPVLARPPSAAYKFQKAFRRNKLIFIAATAVALALLLGIIASTWQSVRATRAKQVALAAEAQAAEAQANEAKLRQQADAVRRHAEVAELIASQHAYASDMNVAAQALAGNNLGRALDLLNRQRPQPGQKDLRGWEWRYLWQQTRGDASFTLCQDTAEVNSLAVSSDGNWLAVSGRQRDGLSVWDLRTRQELIRLAKNETYVLAAFSPREPLLAFTSAAFLSTGRTRMTLRLWNPATRQMVAEFPLDYGCFSLAFANDGRTLVTSTGRGPSGQITLWRMPDGIKLANYPSGQSPMYCGTGFAATSDLSLAAFGLEGGRIGIMDLHNGKELWSAVASKEYITALSFSPDGKSLASGTGFAESAICLWDVATGKQIGHLEGHGSWVSSLLFWPDGKKLASSSADQTIRTWDVASQKCLDVLRGHRQEVWRLALLPDDKTLVSGAKDGTVCFWDTSLTHPHQSRIGIPENVATWWFTSDGRSVLTLNPQARVSRWSGSDFQQQEPLMEIETNHYASCFSSDGRFLAVSWTNGVLQVWNLSQRVLLHQLTNTTGTLVPFDFLADGTKLITFSVSDDLFRELDLTTGLEIQSWQAPPLFNAAINLSPDEKYCVAIGYRGDVVWRNLADNSNTKVDLDVPDASNDGFSPDGKLFAAASNLGYAGVWDAATCRPLATLGGILNGAQTVNFSPDGKRLAVASDGKEAVKLWDTDSWQDVFTLESQGTGIGGARFSPDGNTIAWVAQNTLYLWIAPSWQEINAAEAKQKTEGKQP